MSQQQLSMDDILSGKEQTKEVQEPKAPPAEPAAPAEPPPPHQPNSSLRREHQKREFEAQGRDPETGKFIAKEAPKEEPKAEPAKEAPKEGAKEPAKEPAKPAAPQQEEMTPKERAAFAKAADETRKRQALEARLRELEAKQAPASTEPPKTFWDDPEAALARQQQEIQKAIVGTRLQTSEAIARSRHADFDEKVAIFSELAQTTPGLAQQMLAASDPAEFVYRTAANHKAIKDAGGVDALIAKAREEERIKVRAELEKELNEKAAALAKERAALPSSLSDAQSKGNQRPVWSGPPSMAEILKG